MDPARLLIPSIDIVITEQCSLRCRDCSNLMQYYTHPVHVDYDNLFSSLDILMRSIDHVLEFRVLGGETFMNPRAHEYIDRLKAYSNFTRITVFSNGTICPTPKQLESLAADSTCLHISNYGGISRQIEKISTACDASGVTYEVDAMPGWHDCAGISYRDRTQAELEAVYANCCANKFLTLLHGLLYLCPFSAHANNIGALPAFPQESLNLNRDSIPEEVRIWLFDNLRMRRFTRVCAYCAGRPLGALTLPVAIQSHLPLPYMPCYRKDTIQ